MLENSNKLILDPIQLFAEELRMKNIKKQSIQEIQTILIVMNQNQIIEELVPLLIRTFIHQNLEIRVCIVSSFQFIAQYIIKKNRLGCIVEFIIDVLCVFNEEQIRKQSFRILELLVKMMEKQIIKRQFTRVVGQLQKQVDKNIKQVNLILIKYLLSASNEQDKDKFIEKVKQYLQGQTNQLILCEFLPLFIEPILTMSFGQIKSILLQLMKCNYFKVKSKIINSVIPLAKINQSQIQDIIDLLINQNSQVKASLILNIREINQTFSSFVVQKITKNIQNFQNQDNTIKNAILQVLQFIPISQQRKKEIMFSPNYKTLSLSKTLANTLCRINDQQALINMIQNSDTQFKNKLFSKLGPTSQVHLILFQHLLNQKNWRAKIPILQNIQKRLNNSQSVQILLPKLIQQIGDKIAVIRITVAKLISDIIVKRGLKLMTYSKRLLEGVNSKLWQQRQTALVIIQRLIQLKFTFDFRDRTIVNEMILLIGSDKVIDNKQMGLKIKNLLK